MTFKGACRFAPVGGELEFSDRNHSADAEAFLGPRG
jgi:hypothetical protein